MDITDDTLAYSGVSVLGVLLLCVVIFVIKYSCTNTGKHKYGLLLEDPVSEV